MDELKQVLKTIRKNVDYVCLIPEQQQHFDNFVNYMVLAMNELEYLEDELECVED